MVQASLLLPLSFSSVSSSSFVSAVLGPRRKETRGSEQGRQAVFTEHTQMEGTVRESEWDREPTRPLEAPTPGRPGAGASMVPKTAPRLLQVSLGRSSQAPILAQGACVSRLWEARAVRGAYKSGSQGPGVRDVPGCGGWLRAGGRTEHGEWWGWVPREWRRLTCRTGSGV